MADHVWKGIHLVGQPGRFDVEVTDGRFTLVRPAAPGSHQQPERWLSPGLVDLHTHLAWTDFHHEDQQKRSAAEVESLQAQAVVATLRAGFTSVRDAGGLSPALARRLTGVPGAGLRLWPSGEALGAADARGLDHVEQRVRRLVDEGVRWIKVFATGGLGADPEAITTPVLPRDHVLHVVRTAHGLGARVFVHTWGGPTIDWSIEAGVDSVEHGIYLTRDQAGRMADAGMALVPTAAIYQLLADPSGPQDPGPVFRDRAARAVEAQGHALASALAAGVRIGVGTDFGSPDLHGHNLWELDALASLGMPRDQVWRAATEGGAIIVGDGGLRGTIAEGWGADAVVFRTDPLATARFANLEGALEAVLVGGRVVY